MKWVDTPTFSEDWRRLSNAHREMFLQAIPDFSEARDGFFADPAQFKWPQRLRVSRLQGVHGVWEMTWSFAGPDGRATFDFIQLEGDLVLRWRRIGGHAIYRKP
ncbi:MAG: hypothetical protein U0990_06075 [Candidatus Nanopelagicales bacterium]|nr:hypothetical protein [Candidatus Nanopelagicales bacterium]MDZ4249640.1 hypothetical protein [Candidatus Nanopelagicales bacterium]